MQGKINAITRIIANWWRGETKQIDGVYPGVRYSRHWTSIAVQRIYAHLKNNFVPYSCAVLTVILSTIINSALN